MIESTDVDDVVQLVVVQLGFIVEDFFKEVLLFAAMIENFRLLTIVCVYSWSFFSS